MPEEDFTEKLVFDKNGDIKSWKIVYCGWVTPKMLLDEKAPYKTAYVSADTAEEAAKKLKDDLRLSKIDVAGEPVLELITREEYENGWPQAVACPLPSP